MGLNSIELPSFLIADLYKNSLIENNDGATTVLPETETIKKIQYLGKNKKSICLLVNYENDVYLPDNELNFLTTILQACKLNLGDVAIVNYHLQKTLFDDLIKQFNCSYLLIFGIDAKQLGLNKMQEFTAQKINKCYVVFSPAPEQFNNNSAEGKLLKSKLWLCLKKLFDV